MILAQIWFDNAHDYTEEVVELELDEYIHGGDKHKLVSDMCLAYDGKGLCKFIEKNGCITVIPMDKVKMFSVSDNA